MALDSVTILGLVAGAFTTISFIPQVIKTYKLKCTKDISLGMFSLLGVGIFTWTIYGFLINSVPIIVSNSVSLVFVVIILGYKLTYK